MTTLSKASGVLNEITEAAALLAQKQEAAEIARGIRDAWIRDARALGISLREIGEAAGLHHTAILKIERGGSR